MKKNNLKKKTLSIISITMCLIMAFAAGLIGCTPPEVTEEIEVGKSQIYVGVFDAGFKTAFIESAKAKFEAKYENISFEPGKEGVQIVIECFNKSCLKLGKSGFVNGAVILEGCNARNELVVGNLGVLHVLPREYERLAVVRLQAEETVNHRIKSLFDEQRNGQKFALGFAHLAGIGV